ncbi:immunoglobulin-like domain-containing protein, partial [Halomonas alkaliantarctica]|uniref:immunoglobulin-like domain-containing protein n=1 Tax=Halomonas alkaliantarctica TaxID=232346 RepID=UPI00265A4D78
SVQSGGDEFENLNVDDTATVTVKDTVDIVTVGLTATGSVAEGGQITYTATLTDANGDPVTTNNAITVTLTNGEVITIAANSSEGEITVAAPADDAY